jgi:hypothetical protein
MITRLRFKTMLAGAVPEHLSHLARPGSHSIAAVEAAAQALRHGCAVTASAAEGSFGQRLKRAVTDRLASRSRGSVVASSAPGAGFGERLRKAVEQRSGRKRHQAQAERERARYQQPQHRQRGKGD